jgi:enoyl-CoA hydratase/carnithine racemase
MFVSHLSGRVLPDVLESALSADFVAADPDSTLVLREGRRAISPAVARRRGVHHFAYRVTLAPEVSARAAFEEGWVDALGTAADLAAWQRGGELSWAARAAASSLMAVPSRAGALALERAHFALIQASEEKRERIDAFFASRASRSGPS